MLFARFISAVTFLFVITISPSVAPSTLAQEPPTKTPAVPTDTPAAEPPTKTPVPPTDTPAEEPPTKTPLPATDTPMAEPPTKTPVPQAGTPTATPTRTPLPCVGDCDGSGDVQINEIISCVNIALGTAQLSVCTSCDANGDGEVAINELILAVNAALTGCTPVRTPTPGQAACGNGVVEAGKNGPASAVRIDVCAAPPLYNLYQPGV